MAGRTLIRIALFGFLTLLAAPAFSENDPEAPGLSPQERRRIIRNQELRWDYSEGEGRSLAPPRETSARDSDRRALRAERASREGALIVQVREIAGAQDYDIAFDNLRLSIPAAAFASATRVRISAIVLSKPADFVFASPDLRMVENGRVVLLESTGMFRLSFNDETGRPLEPAAPLTASMPLPSIGGAQEARVYQYRNEQWIERAASAVESGALSSSIPLRLTQFAPGPTSAPNNPTYPTPVESPCVECGGSAGFHFPQIYRRIDSGGWWNFDIPKPEFTCISVRVEGASPQSVVAAAGVDFQGISYGEPARDGVYRLNTLRNRKIKVYATDVVNDDSFRAGALPLTVSPDYQAHTSNAAPNCPLLGRIVLQQQPIEVLKDRERFLRIIDWPLE